MKGKNLQPRLLYLARISFRFNGEIQSFIDKQKLREFSTTKPALQQMLENFSKWETQEKERTYKNKPITIQKMVIGTYISIITLNVNGLNAPTKRHRLAEWIQKQDPYICCLQETMIRFPVQETFPLIFRLVCLTAPHRLYSDVSKQPYVNKPQENICASPKPLPLSPNQHLAPSGGLFSVSFPLPASVYSLSALVLPLK